MKEILLGTDKRKRIWQLLFVVMLILASCRFFYRITGDYFTFLDEYQTFDTAAGFTHTGKFYMWDFHDECLSDLKYTRAWPHTVLLMLWFRLFGIHVVAGKTLSCVFGVLFIASVFYISGKLYKNYVISVLSCLIVMTNLTVVTVFRQIRMYSLWLLLMVWAFYFVYKALTSVNSFRHDNRMTRFILKYFNFSWPYVLASFCVLFLGVFVHINTLIAGVGMLLYAMYRLVCKREKKFAAMIGLVGAATALVLLLIALMRSGVHIPALSDVYESAIKEGKLGFLEEANTRYIGWLITFVGSRKLFWLSLVCVLAAFVKNRRQEGTAYDFSVYAFLIVASSLLCFLYVLDRYYQERYMLYVAPLMAMLMAWGLTEVLAFFGRRWIYLAGLTGCVLLLGRTVVREYGDAYFNDKICYHRIVYEKIREDAGERETVALGGFDFRDYYAAQVFDSYERVHFDRKNDMEFLKELAEDYPQGYVVGETVKIYGFPEVIRLFIQNHSERIAGEGIDSYNIEAIRYHFLDPQETMTEMYGENVAVAGPVTYSFQIQGGETNLRILVDTAALAEEADVLFLTFGIFTTEKETEDKCYQLRIPQGAYPGICSYEVQIPHPCQVVQYKNESMIYYKDGTCSEETF